MPDALWAEMEPLLPPRKRHPLGCHNPRVQDRKATSKTSSSRPGGDDLT
ncbi:hypothetical protein A7982_13322 [Minicystis rosea]|nr:hypothetical protein A7982_13322 [Minicystis rosea]